MLDPIIVLCCQQDKLPAGFERFAQTLANSAPLPSQALFLQVPDVRDTPLSQVQGRWARLQV